MERLSGPLDVAIPVDAIAARLSNEPATVFNVSAILDDVGRAAGWIRLQGLKQVSPAEIIEEAERLREKTNDLWMLVDAMHPSTRAFVRERARDMPDSAIRALVRLQAALDLALQEMKSAVKPGPSSFGQRNRSLTLVYQSIRKHSTPVSGKEAARALASDLLSIVFPDRSWPSDRDELRRITG